LTTGLPWPLTPKGTTPADRIRYNAEERKGNHVERHLDDRRSRALGLACEERRLDAILCHLGENLLPLTGYWPNLWFSYALILPDGSSVVVCPEMEEELASKGWADIQPFSCLRFGDPEPECAVIAHLLTAARSRKLRLRRIGYEGGFDLIGPAAVAVEQPATARATIERITAAFGEPELVDITDLLYEVRAVKTAEELQGLRVASAVAEFGLQAFAASVEAGRTEAEVAAAVESAVRTGGTGFSGVRVARACAQVVAGTLTAEFWHYPVSRSVPIQSGELVAMEMGVVADGYWADVARVRVAGAATREAEYIAESIQMALDAAARAAAPGVAASVVDAASYDVIRERGLEEYCVHSLGHGFGFGYHETIPVLDSASSQTLEPGMAIAIEPGVYIPGRLGVRIENDLIITDTGSELLTTFDTALS
jgi:Xaa-Pro dipeptidase